MATGSIRNRTRKDGSANYQITIELGVDPVDGERKRISKGGIRTKKEAEKILHDMIADINNKKFIKSSKISVKAWLTDWLDTYIKPHKSPTTTEAYVLQVERYIIPALGGKLLQELSVNDIQKFYNSLQIKSPLSDKPLSAKSIRNIHMNLQAACEKAVEQEIIPKNPAKMATLPKTKKYEADAYSMEEIKKLFEAAKGAELELAIHILILLGLRRGELLALRWVNVDLENGIVNIIENAVRANRERIIKEPKSESGKRKIDMPESLIRRMKRAKLDYTRNKLKHGKDFIDSDLVVCRENGEPYGVDAFSHMVQAFIKKNDLKRLRLHDFRHSNATLLLKIGIAPKVAQKRLGHSDFNTTMNTYSHVLEDMEKEAVQKIELEVFGDVHAK